MWDSAVLTESERAEAKAGLARLLERLSWDRQRWSTEVQRRMSRAAEGWGTANFTGERGNKRRRKRFQDTKLVKEVATLLRSEYPELLQSNWVVTTIDFIR
ncbi:hypothetical protein AK812_SmicGene38633 [Symbiodinium microadriaticum]|uniref:Uncharacterized protein n=1 Tax=Symbiodinium microadriaticum TaxID=2951 RepID=A0A1Q9CDH8_SYMMI|nr:hypothetical protein AK812_SmicGene38633 [Symbiodinium microadriaticum]